MVFLLHLVCTSTATILLSDIQVWMWKVMCLCVALQVDITRDGCGTSKLCVATPDNCDPKENNMCFLATVMAGTPMPPNGTELMFGLAGYSMDFVALGLTSGSSNVRTHVSSSSAFRLWCTVRMGARSGCLRTAGNRRSRSAEELTASPFV